MFGKGGDKTFVERLFGLLEDLFNGISDWE